jgi:hypothetical protein
MRYRALTSDGDMRFGGGRSDWLADSPECVAQAVQTRLLLLRGEWFLDTTEGTPYATEILGNNTQSTRDWAIRTRILETQGVTEITTYDSQFDPDSRAFSVQATISTLYGTTTVQAVL